MNVHLPMPARMSDPNIHSRLKYLQIGEMEAAAEFLRGRGQEVFGVLGHSKGGTEVILYGAKHDSDRLRCPLFSGALSHQMLCYSRTLEAPSTRFAKLPCKGSANNRTSACVKLQYLQK